ncbi:MAG: hypothetical protein IKH04_13040 [Kiritimatiellae bacterium]|nr:hypothetical protein [Kiritimatiellia bacterium]
MKRIVIGDSGGVARQNGANGQMIWIERKVLPAPVGGVVRVAWRDEFEIVEGGEYEVIGDLPIEHGTRETWRNVCLRLRQLPEEGGHVKG